MANNVEVKTKYVFPKMGYFEIDNGTFVYRLMDEITAPKSQEQLAELSRKYKQKGNPHAVGLPKFLSICEDAIKSGNADLLNYIYSKLREAPQFLSRVICNPSPWADKTIHEYGMPDEYSLTGYLVGKEGVITGIDNKNALKLLTGIKNIKRLDKISNEIAGDSMHFSGIPNSKPSEKIEHPVVLGSSLDRLFLYIGRDFWSPSPAFLVQKIK